MSQTPSSLAATFERPLAAFFQAQRAFLFAKGRVGLYAGLRALNLPPGSKVLVPGYTCMVVPSAVQYAGLAPAYVDIDPETYNIDPALLDAAAPPDLASLIVQHTYGIPAEMEVIGQWARGRSLPLVEDCCHVFGSRAGGRLCGTFGAFAFMSGQWNKPFSTGLGGMLLVHDAALAESIGRLVEEQALRPGRITNFVLRCQLTAYDLLMGPRTALLLTVVYRVLNRLGLAVGSSSPEELQGVMPKGYFATMAPCQIRRGARELARIERNMQHRASLTALYHRELPQIGFAPLRFAGAETLPLLRYPVRVANKKEVLARALRGGVEIGSWFECPLHPEGTRMEDFGYRQGMCPEAERASREVINLPTHLRVDARARDRVLRFLGQYAAPAVSRGAGAPPANRRAGVPPAAKQ